MKILTFAINNHDSSYCYCDTEKSNIIDYQSAERLYNFKNATFSLGKIAHGKYKDLDLIVFVDNKNGLSTIGRELVKETKINNLFKNKKIFQIDHHYAHALSSYIYNDNLIAIDGGGNNGDFFVKNKENFKWEKQNIGKSFRISMKALNMHGSVGKIMGLANYYEELDNSFYDKLLNSKDEDKVNLIEKYLQGVNVSCVNPTLKKIYTVHKFLIDKIVKNFNDNFNKGDSISYGGGCALNINTNSILDKDYKLSICPAADDSGLSIGCMNWALNYFGEKISNYKYKAKTDIFKTKTKIKDEDLKALAKKLANNKIVIFCYDEDEIGPRALGHRSILMNPSIKGGKDYINSQVKHREWWRPFGGSIIDTNVIKDYKPSNLDPYMLKSFELKKEYEEMFQSIIHVDNSSRLQIVEKDESDPFYRLVYYFKELTGIPGLLNTSFNLNGYPIASTKYCVNTFKLMDNANIMYFNGEIYRK